MSTGVTGVRYRAHASVWKAHGFADVSLAPPAPGTYKPDVTTTGIASGATLTPYTGDFTITTDGTTLDGLDITGWVVVKAANVTIKNCRIRGGAPKSANTALIDANNINVSNLVVQDCLLVPDAPTLWYDGIIGHDYTIQRCEIYHTVDGCGAYNAYTTGAINVFIYANYIHDLAWFTPDPNHPNDSDFSKSHNDCIQVQGGDNYQIIGNNLQGFIDPAVGNGDQFLSHYPTNTNYTCNSAIQTNQGTSPTTTGAIINNNWADGGGFTFNLASNGSYSSNIYHFDSINNNQFGRKSFYQGSGGDTTYTIDSTSTSTFGSITGNIYEDNGHAVLVRHDG